MSTPIHTSLTRLDSVCYPESMKKRDNNMITMYALKSRKSGRYFKFEQYAEDGWGNYEDSVTFIEPGDLPSMFSGHEIDHGSWYSMVKDHTREEIEVVTFDLRIR